MPLFQHYTRQVTDSQLADLNNIGKYSRYVSRYYSSVPSFQAEGASSRKITSSRINDENKIEAEHSRGSVSLSLTIPWSSFQFRRCMHSSCIPQRVCLSSSLGTSGHRRCDEQQR